MHDALHDVCLQTVPGLSGARPWTQNSQRTPTSRTTTAIGCAPLDVARITAGRDAAAAVSAYLSRMLGCVAPAYLTKHELGSMLDLHMCVFRTKTTWEGGRISTSRWPTVSEPERPVWRRWQRSAVLSANGHTKMPLSVAGLPPAASRFLSVESKQGSVQPCSCLAHL